MSVANNTNETAMRTVSARAVRTPRPVSRLRKKSPENRLISTISSIRMMMSLKSMTGLCTAFRPRPWTTALMLVLVAAFVSLGQWQWGKAQRKVAAQAQFDALRAAPPVRPGVE